MRRRDFDEDYNDEYDQDDMLDIMFDRDEDFNDEDDGCGSFMG